MRDSKGITIVALIITIIITLILVAYVVRQGTTEIDKAKTEDLKATMLLIKGRAQIAVEKDSFGEEYDKTGMLAYADASTYTSNIPSDLDAMLPNDKTNLYIWTQEAMDNNGIDVTITTDDFFIIDYDTMEIYSTTGYTIDDTTYYSLTSLQEL